MKIKKRKKILLLAVLSAILISFFLSAPIGALAFDDEVMWDEYEIPSSRQKDRFVDAANLLSESTRKELQDRMDEVSERWQCNIIILTVDEHTGPIQDYADDYFDYNGFGTDYDGSGVLFMLSMDDREWAISTSGNAIAAFTDYGQEKMMDDMLPDLGDGYYYSAFNTYIDTADRYLELYENGTPFDVGIRNATAEEMRGAFVVCIIIGLIIGLIPVGIMISALTTVRSNSSASGYQSHSGIKMKFHQDTYLRSTVSKAPIPKEDSRSSGGSSIHTSSSGSSHGGSHGHF